ncbi:TRPA1-like protein [Mya arenaria]|uniref:TRPA1-like protein n=1 Tax=Mya arenaria TaxID=6604 RepID=A0ABY7DDH9_MYAAR|nr:TRPA1-like protein [Mya arenaria]
MDNAYVEDLDSSPPGLEKGLSNVSDSGQNTDQELDRLCSVEFKGLKSGEGLGRNLANTRVQRKSMMGIRMDSSIWQIIRDDLVGDLQYQLRRNPDLINSTDNAGNTPIHVAAKYNRVQSLAVLMEFKAAVEWKGLAGKGAILNHTDNEGNSALHLAVQNNKLENTNYTPLHMAVIGGHIAIVKELLYRGADLEARDGDHMTPVHRCAMYGKTDVLQVLLEKGANINARTSEQMTPLLVATWKGHLHVIEFLLSNGAKVKATDSCMRTALHWAVDQEHYNILQALMKSGGNDLLRLVDHRDQTVAHYAARTGNTMMLKFGNYTSVEMLIATSRSETNDGDSDGRSPLMAACLSGHYKAARSLLALGADNSIRDENYCTALILAASKGHVKVMQLLIDNFAEVNACDKIKVVMDNCVQESEHRKDDPDYSLTYDYKYIDPGPDDPCCKNRRYFALDEAKLSHLEIHHAGLTSMQWILEVFILLLLFKELFLLWGQKWRYFINPYTYCNWIMMASTLVFINPPNRYPCENNWRGAWISSLCAWTLLISYLQRLDVVGIYFVMFGEVMFSIGKVMLVLVLFLMAFAQAFGAVLAQRPGFRDEDFFPLTVLSMTLGEIGFVETFVESNNSPFTVDSYIILILFVIVMPIALMNLLIGIAVGDIDKIQKQAYIKRIGLQLKYYMFGIQTSVEFIAQSEKDFTVETLQEIQKNVQKNRNKLNQIQTKVGIQQDLLKNLCDHFHIEIKNDPDNVSLLSERTDFQSRFDFV